MTDWKTLLDDIADSAPVKYGMLEGRPVVITDSRLARGYWLIDGRWVLMNPGDVTHNVGLRTKESFEKRFPSLARGLAQARAARTASKGTPREGLMKRLSDNPRFVKSKESWKALIIVGAKPSVREMKTWFITGKLAGNLFARADDGELRDGRANSFLAYLSPSSKSARLSRRSLVAKGRLLMAKKAPA